MFQTLVERMWYLMSIQASGPSITDPKLQEVLGDVAQSMSLPLTILLTPASLPSSSVSSRRSFYLMLRLVQPENVQFRTVFRVIAYSAAPTVVCIVPLVGPLVGSIWFGVAASSDASTPCAAVVPHRAGPRPALPHRVRHRYAAYGSS